MRSYDIPGSTGLHSGKERKKASPWQWLPWCLCTASMLYALWTASRTPIVPGQWLLMSAASAAALTLCTFARQLYASRKKQGRAPVLKTFCILTALAAALGGYFLGQAGKAFEKMLDTPVSQKASGNTGTQDNPVSPNYTEKEPEHLKPFLIMVTGRDTWHDPDREPGRDTSEEGRSDVNILAAVDPENHKVLLISTPRDAYVQIPGVTDQDGYEAYDKLSHAGVHGNEAVMSAHEWLYGEAPDYYLETDFTAFVDAIDALGGVDVDAEAGAYMANGFSWEEGMNHFDGGEALAFVRERKAFDDGDFQRGRHQQALIKALIKKCATPAGLLKLPAAMEAASDGVSTDMPASLIKKLIGNQASGNPEWKVENLQLSCTDGRSTECFSMPGYNLYVAMPDEESRKEISETLSKFLGKNDDDQCPNN